MRTLFPYRPSPPSPLPLPPRRRVVAEALEAVLDTFAPRGCAACDAELPRAVLRPFCAACVVALEPGEPWAPYRYGGAVQTAILRLKYRDRTDLAAPLGRLLGRWARVRALVDPHAVVAPVASSPGRIAERGYCHATLLAKAVGAELGLPVMPFALERANGEGTQKGRGRDERLVAMAGAFRGASAIRGRRVLLVDDVVTTGATRDAAAEALRIAGATRVQPLVLAWTAPRGTEAAHG